YKMLRSKLCSHTDLTVLDLPYRTHVAGRTTRCRNIAFQSVIHHHAIGVEAPAQGADGALHALDPAARQTIMVAMVVEGNHLFAQHAVQVFPIAGVVH